MAKKEKKKMLVSVKYDKVAKDVDLEVLYSPGFDPKNGPKVEKKSNGDILIISNTDEVLLPVTMWNHGAGFGGISLEYTEDDGLV